MPKLLFITVAPFFPEAAGGAELSHLFLFYYLQTKGWEVRVICGRKTMNIEHKSIKLPKKTQNVYLLNFLSIAKNILFSFIEAALFLKFTEDKKLGFSCWRGPMEGRCGERFILEQLNHFIPSIVVSDFKGRSNFKRVDKLLNVIARKGFKVFCFVRTRECFWKERLEKFDPSVVFIANSPFIKQHLTKALGRDVVCIMPFIKRSDCIADKKDPRYITFINTVREKGLLEAIQIAQRMPGNKFLFIKGHWASGSYDKENPDIKEAQKLPNVLLMDFQDDMREVYKLTKTLLVPSQFEEAFGRVIIEAHFNGIPVVAADVGGIRYILGEGGVVVSPRDNIDGYVTALTRLSCDQRYYQELSQRAYENSMRGEFDAEAQVEKFILLTGLDIKKDNIGQGA